MSDCEMSAIHGLLSCIPVDLPFESLLVECQKLFEQFPPYSIEQEAAEDLRRQEKEREMTARSRGVVPVKKTVTYTEIITKIVIYSAPVIVGVLVWRMVQT